MHELANCEENLDMKLMSVDIDELHENSDKLVDLRRAFVADGAVIVTGVVDKDAIGRLQSGAEIFSDARQDGEKKYAPFIHIQRERDEYRELVRNKNLVQFVELLLGAPAEMIQAMLYYKPPGYLGFNKHQDNFFCEVDPPDAMVVAWVAVDEADEENGCLYVYPGTHREPVLPMRAVRDPGVGKQSTNFNERDHEAVVPEKYKRVIARVPEGGVAFMHSHLVHESGSNLSTTRFRRAVAIDYIRMNAPFRPGNSAKRYRFNLYD